MTSCNKFLGRGEDLVKTDYWVRFCLRCFAGIGSLVAVLYFLLLPAFRYTNGPEWTCPELVARDTSKASSKVTSSFILRFKVKRCQFALNTSLQKILHEHNSVLPAGLVFSLRLQEQPQETIIVTVQAKAGKQVLAGKWQGQYANVGSFLAQTDDIAAIMVEDLLRHNP